MGMSLDQRVYVAFAADDTGGGLTSRAHDGIVGHKSEHELDLVDWGACFGIAFGIARGEDPWEPLESVLNRAFDAATIAFRRFSGGRVSAANAEA